MMRSILFAVVLFLSGVFVDRNYLLDMPAAVYTASVGDDSSYRDGYVFERSTLRHGDTDVSFVLHPSRKSMQEYFNDPTLAAITLLWDKDGRHKCEVHLVDPNVLYEPQYAGHEIFHCLYGAWHPSYKSR